MKLTNTMKLTGMAAASALALSSAQAEIELSPNLKISGFADMSAYIADTSPGDSENGMNLDQVEIDLAASFEKVTGNIDLEWRTGGDVTVEQAYVTYKFDEQSSFTAGRFLSYMGYEGDEPYKLFQYSYAYDFGLPYAGYNDGVKYDYAEDKFSFGAALLSANYGRDSRVTDEFGIEAKATFTPVDGLTIFAGYSYDSKEFSDNISYYNLWVQYQKEKLTLAAEIGKLDDEDAASGLPSHLFWLVMANYAVSDTVGITGRISAQDVDDGGGSNLKFTFSPSYKISSNLLAVFEASYTDYSDVDIGEGEELKSGTFFAAELLFTF